MDCIILAAGENARLQSVLPPAYKPLIVVNGETLIGQCLRRADEMFGRKVIVCAPSNAEAIVHVASMTTRAYDYIVQPQPLGPFDAIKRGLRLCTSDYVCVIMADNLIPNGVITGMLDCFNQAASAVVSTVTMRASAAARFTWWDTNIRGWRDKEESAIDVQCWVGPLIAPRDYFERYSDWASILGASAVQFQTACVDVGSIEVLTAATEHA